MSVDKVMDSGRCPSGRFAALRAEPRTASQAKPAAANALAHVIRATVIGDITAERRRQIEDEGWSVEHDDAHFDGSLALAAACYAAYAGGRRDFVHARGHLAGFVQPRGWPWDFDAWKPKGGRRDLIRAAALIVAEIERLDRASAAGARSAETNEDSAQVADRQSGPSEASGDAQTNLNSGGSSG